MKDSAVEDVRQLRVEWMIKAIEAEKAGNTLTSKGWIEYANVAAEVIEFLEGRLTK